MGRPWMKFYPADWRDARLRRCSLAARGLWIDLMTYMHEAEPYGHLLIAGENLPLADLALQLARPASEVKRALAELKSHGVFSQTESGVIYSRRMVRDKAKEIIDRENGKGGGNPRLSVGVNPPVKPSYKPPDKASDNVNVNVADKAQWPLVSSEDSLGLEEPQREQATGRKRKNKTPLPENFAPDREFPRKLGWPERRIDEQIQAFFDGARAHSRVYADWQAAWRNWCTSPFQKPVEANGHAKTANPDDQKAVWKMVWDYWIKHGVWKGRGPDPNSAGCHIPQELREEWSQQQ